MHHIFEGLAARPKGEISPLTVTELTCQIKERIEGLGPVWLQGEISNLKYSSSGHIYLTLKDQENQIAAVIWRHTAVTLPFNLSDGMAVLVLGTPTVYGPQGRYQIAITVIEPQGVGALQIAFSQLKQRLAQEGLFDKAKKRRIPFLPRKIGIVTSPKGAAIQDILNVIDRRFPKIDILIYPARVQGKGAAEEIAQGIKMFNRLSYGIEVIIIGRGGGSLEDLWPFNEEIVARSIAASRIPIISAVGHEIDVTIADLTADRRALTPSEAAEIAVPRYDKLSDYLHKHAKLLKLRILHHLSKSRATLDKLAAHCLLGRPLTKIREREQTLDYLSQRLSSTCSHLFHDSFSRLVHCKGRLQACRPSEYLLRTRERLDAMTKRLQQAFWNRYEKEYALLMRIRERLDGLSKRLQRALLSHFEKEEMSLLRTREYLDGLTKRLQRALLSQFEKEEALLMHKMERLIGLAQRLPRALVHQFQNKYRLLTSLSSHLEGLSPLQVLRRGYSITQRVGTDEVIHNAGELSPGDRIRIRLSQGWLLATLEKTWLEGIYQ